jgi:hypothetical protein
VVLDSAAGEIHRRDAECAERVYRYALAEFRGAESGGVGMRGRGRIRGIMLFI